MSTAVVKLDPAKRSILGALAERYGMDPKAFEITIRKMAMPEKHSDEEFAACCIVAKEHNLNPFTREIYFMRTKGGAIQPIVGVDGWIRKCNEHPAFDGVDFEDILAADKLAAIKCIIHRKDRQHPIVVTEYLIECQRPTDNWKSMPSRMLRHRALIQCARVAFGFAGLMDPDEFEQWQDLHRGESRDEFSEIKLAPKKALELPDIPDIQPSTPAQKEAAPPAPAPARQPDIKPDAAYLEDIRISFAAATDLDSLNEVLVHNETATEDRGLQQKVSDLYQMHKVRIYDAMT